ncbi:MAG: hypothetical protein D6706_06805 [Chloroflexi bacterium]|nr:MAG: hypothetical protein D6706_06805 [Chloroflexota bacterium]
MADGILTTRELDAFRQALERAFGGTIQRPIPARLGFRDNTGAIHIRVPSDKTDQPDKYYFHEAGGQGFHGEAYLQTGALADWQIRFGAPIRIMRDVLSGEWTIAGIDHRFAQQFFSGVSETDEKLYFYEHLAPARLYPTDPNSMQARVLAAYYRVDDNYYYVPTMTTVDFGSAPHSANIPSSKTRARLALITVSPQTASLGVYYGSEFPATYKIDAIASLDGGTGTYLPPPSTGEFVAGYVKLAGGMVAITTAHIIPAQQYLSMASSTGTQQLFDNIVTDGGDVVVDDISGTVTYI